MNSKLGASSINITKVDTATNTMQDLKKNGSQKGRRTTRQQVNANGNNTVSQFLNTTSQLYTDSYSRLGSQTLASGAGDSGSSS